MDHQSRATAASPSARPRRAAPRLGALSVRASPAPQAFYGTCVYFFQYFYNQRYKRSSMGIPVVVPSNAFWIVFPLLGMWASADLILSSDYRVFGH